MDSCALKGAVRWSCTLKRGTNPHSTPPAPSIFQRNVTDTWKLTNLHFFDPEDGGSMYLRNVASVTYNHTVR
jgi:hypothetical protein